MRKVWLVTTGDYSDYSVVVAFTTKELADAYAEAYNTRVERPIEEYRVEEYPLLDALPGPDRTRWYASQGLQDGVLQKSTEYASEVEEWRAVEYEESVFESSLPGFVVVGVGGPDRDEVRRRLREKVAALLQASNAKLTPSAPENTSGGTNPISNRDG